MIALVEERQARVGIAPLCDALGLTRATFYRRRGGPPPDPSPPRARRAPRQALTPTERARVLAVLHEERFVDLPPAQVWAQLLDAGQVPPCSIRTMYRVLAANVEVRERRNQLRHPAYRKPELLATGPNQVWSWDITKLLGPVKWTYYYLYVLLDIFSRYVVGWLLARQEAAALAKVLIAESCERQHIGPDQLTIHADRGPSMTSQPVALLLATLGIVPSHSRPQVSDDNPFSEAQFKTLKYRPDFPARFGAYEDAEAFCQRFFPWYNIEHRHSALGLMTPHDIHYGLAQAKWQRRADLLRAAYHAHPERFPRGVPVPPPLPTAAWINKPLTSPAGAAPEGILRAHAQLDRLQDPAAYPAWDDPGKRTQEGESRRLEVETRGRSPARMVCKISQRSRSYAGQPIGGRIVVRRIK
jgi:putative transposase